MLAVLRVENLAIVQRAEIEFTSGLNVLTGETGAGKSIVLKAIGLIAGQRASNEIIRSEAERCTVEALFEISSSTREQLISLADEMESLLADEELIIRRSIERSGRSKVYINGALASISLLQRISSALIDITGQHQQHTLLSTANHIHLLDEFGVPESLREETAAAYQLFAKARHDLESYLRNTEQQQQLYQRILSEHEELSEAAIEPGERALHEAELARLSNVESLGQEASECIELLEDAENGLEEQLRRLLSGLERATRLDPTLKEAQEFAETAEVQLSEVKIALEDYLSSLEADPSRLEFLRERIALIARLERKYMRSGDELIELQQELEAKIAELEGGGLDEKKLRARMDEARLTLSKLESSLSAKRQEVAKKLSSAVEKGLKELSMKRARFKVEIEPCDSGPNGADKVSFTLAANPGEPFRELAKVASGGELSRILLVLKTLLNERFLPQTQIFDEIDSGIGGAVAQVVGEKLRQASLRVQVILITHAPQIAALADSQFLVAKTAKKNSTESKVEKLSDSDRIGQIAAMMAGKEVTAKFEESAKELLSLGKARKR